LERDSESYPTATTTTTSVMAQQVLVSAREKYVGLITFCANEAKGYPMPLPPRPLESKSRELLVPPPPPTSSLETLVLELETYLQETAAQMAPKQWLWEDLSYLVEATHKSIELHRRAITDHSMRAASDEEETGVDKKPFAKKVGDDDCVVTDIFSKSHGPTTLPSASIEPTTLTTLNPMECNYDQYWHGLDGFKFFNTE
jgi:hypothetical protein